MSLDRLLSPKALAAIGVAMVLLFILSSIDFYRDPRPVAEVAEIEAIAERDDLNLLFIVIDTLRADRLSGYGYGRETSPGLDYLAREGIRFSRHRAQSSWTKNSMASMWTGLHPVRSGVLRHGDALPAEARLPAEILRDAGFVTAGIWRNGWVAPNFGFAQGFETYQSPLTRSAPSEVRRKARAGRIDGTDIDTILSANQFMRTNIDRRWFLYLHLMDVHQYVTNDESAIFGNSYSDAYDNSILWVDLQIRALTGELDRLGLRDRTLIAVVSDHGEAFGEHGLEGHARNVYSEVTHTPWILGLPLRIRGGIVVRDVTENVDVWPTLLELLGLPPMPESDGISRLPAIVRAPKTIARGDQVDFAHLDRTWGRVNAEPSPTIGVRDGRFRLVRYLGEEARDELYDLQSDPLEQTNVAPLRPAILKRLQGRADSYMEQEIVWSEGVTRVDLDEMDLMQLRALGYSIDTR
ncbi:MAG: sulfatase [Deltaproteobacteria bacterium]|nr:sulfatase [Deltaproteobacteria bacterium]